MVLYNILIVKPSKVKLRFAILSCITKNDLTVYYQSFLEPVGSWDLPKLSKMRIITRFILSGILLMFLYNKMQCKVKGRGTLTRVAGHVFTLLVAI